MTISYPLDTTTADSWRSAVRRLIPTPDGHRRADVDRTAAKALLNCDDATLDLLVSAGIPSSGGGSQLRFDRFDLVNVAIYGGAGRSVPEGAQRFLLRYADGSPEGWTVPRNWTMDWLLNCDDPGCGAGWRIRLPVPELFGGRRGGPGAQGEGEIKATGPAVRITAELLTGGFRTEVRSPIARELYAELLAELETERLRFQWLPDGLGCDLRAALGNGTVNCVAAALLLAERGRERGLATRTRRGRMLGMVAVDHAWAEVRDTDGRWLPLDPIFALLGGAGRSGRAREEFRAFCSGSVPSRFLPWDVPAGEPLVEHECPAGEWRETFLATPA